MKNLLNVISKFLFKSISVGSINTSIGTIITTAVVATTVSGGTVYAVSENFKARVNTNNNITQEQIDLTENVNAEEMANNDLSNLPNISSETSMPSIETYVDESGNEVEVNSEDIHSHSFSTEITKEATCTENGIAVDTCSTCDYSRTYTTPTKNHTAGEWIIKIEPTATADGLREQYCTVCNTLLAQEVMPVIPCVHEYAVVDSKEATCTSSGYKMYKCPLCGSSYEETVSSLGHDFSQEIIENSTCTTEGHTYNKCSRCDEKTQTGVIIKKEHNYTPWKVTKEATCTNTGVEEHICSLCNKKEVRDISASGHDIQEIGDISVTTEPTCTNKGFGISNKKCSKCDAENYEVEIPARGHDYSEVVETVAPTCTEKGYTVYKCSRCDSTIKADYTEALGHTASEWIIDTPATCTEVGSKHKECTVCHTVLNTEEIPVLGHNYSEFVETIAPTCTIKGYDVYKCVRCDSTEKKNYTNELGHSEGSWIIDTASTCNETGSRHTICTRDNCGITISTEETPALGHNYSEFVETIAPTCTVKGYDTYKCARCDSTTKKNDVEALGHTVSGWIIDTPATCTEVGLKHKECTVCLETLTTVEIPALGHIESGWIIDTPATCTTAGSKHTKCNTCDVTINTAIIPVLGHNYSEVVETVAPTCTEKGYTVYKCSRCDSTIKADYTEALGHTASEWITDTPATCTEVGSKHKECTVCHTVLNTEEIPVLGHDWKLSSDEKTYPVGCESDGCNHYVCERCSLEKDVTINKTGHTESDWIVDTSETCVSSGLRHTECTVCGAEIKSEEIPALGHNYSEFVETIAPTCTETGHDIYKCSRCNSTENKNTTESTGHTVSEWIIDTPATCTTAGEKHSKCTVCEEILERKDISATGHIESDWITDTSATCTEVGSKHTECTKCKTVMKTEEISATGHTESNWITDTYATCTEVGSKHKECTVCEALLKTEEIPVLGHDYTELVRTVSPTCTEQGYDIYKCSRCEDTSNKNFVNATGHIESDWIIDTPATCTEVGSKHKECTICEEILETEEISALGHTESNWIIDKDHTCTEVGSKHKECTVCGTILNTEEIPLTEHNYVFTETINPTCTSQGYDVYTCSGCNNTDFRNYTDAYDCNNFRSDWIIDIAPTCQLEGSKHIECQKCNKVLETSSIEKVAHSFTNYVEITPATDLSEGLSRATCDYENCEETDDRVLAQLPHIHNYETEIERVEPTCTEAGYSKLQCRCNGVLTNDLPSTGHDYQITVDTAANCLTDGITTYVCSKCSDTYSNVHSATGHTSGDWEITRAATDLSEGCRVRKCTSCGSILETEAISKLPHTCTFDNLSETQAATCTTDGFELYTCRCGLSNRVVLPKLNHANNSWQTTKEPSYTELGIRKQICNDCGYIMAEESIAVIPHECSYSVVTDIKPTCTSEGYTTSSCTKCGDTKTVNYNALGHTAGDWETVNAATCTSDGLSHKVCITCGTELESQPISATGHNEGSWVTDSDATCTTDGSKHTACTVCGEQMSTASISATGHNMGGFSVTTEAGCETEGTETSTCSKCSYSVSRSIPATGHSYGEWIDIYELVEVPVALSDNNIPKETITENRVVGRFKECSKCGNKITEEVEHSEPHVHSYSETSRTESSCSTAGSIIYACSCGASYSEEIAKIAHTAGGWEVKTPATETTTGLEVTHCSVCGAECETRVIDIIPHSHNYSETRVEPTCTSSGSITRSCSCGDTQVTTLPATGHSYGSPTVVEPTCTEDGSSIQKCSVCEHEKTTVIPKTGHDYIETNIEPATCTSTGTKTSTCDNCGDIKTEEIPTLAHTFEVTSTTEATCTAGGVTIKTCKNCGETENTDETEALGHDEGSWIVKTEAALGIAGEEELKCTRCSEILETREIPMITTDGTNTVYTINIANNQTTNVIGYYDDSQAEEMLALINNYRVDNGKTALVLGSSNLISFAETRAVETSYIWDHVRPYNGAEPKYGENIATSNMSTTTVQEIFDSWINSAGHKNNILKDTYTKTAIKVFYQRRVLSTGKEVYIPYWVECFY